MSTIKVNRIENTSTTDGGVSIDVDGHVTIDGQQLPTAGPLSNRNLIINGAMEVDQRNNGSSFTVTGTNYAIDRFQVRAQSISSATTGRSTDVPDGFTNSIFLNVGASPVARAAGDNRQIRQLIEGLVSRRLQWGTANAKSATISFWVKSSVTGTYDFAFFSSSTDQSYITQYTINSANTWEYKTISVPGATSGTFNINSGVGLYCHWDLGSGSDYQSSTLDQWISGDKRASTSGTDLFSTANASFYLTGVQLEVGSKATPFEHELYSQTLTKCQRYYQISDGFTYLFRATDSIKQASLLFPVEMNRTPDVVVTSGGSGTTSALNHDEKTLNLRSTDSAMNSFTYATLWTADAEL